MFVTALIGMGAFGAATQGYGLVRATWFERIVLLAVTFLLLHPRISTDVVGLVLLAGVYGWQYLRLRNAPAPAA